MVAVAVKVCSKKELISVKVLFTFGCLDLVDFPGGAFKFHSGLQKV